MMKSQKTSYLYKREQFIEFYEDRYQQNYMEEWPIERKKRIVEVIQELQLPAKGEALDFGCGNGVLTEVLRQALPSWKIYGTDISKTAVANAKIRYPNCTFFEPNSPDFTHKKFDFVFTNHVFEHVLNLSEVFDQMNQYLKQESSMLHFLPCGNEGSFEYSICLLRKDGINAERENRFYFEDQGHVRRLTTGEFCSICQTKGFQLQKEFYSNQYHGAIEWITNSNPKFVQLFCDTSQAVNKEARQKLKNIRTTLLIITALRLPVQIVTNMLQKRNKQIKHYLLLLAGLPFFLFSNPIDKHYKRKARQEWDTNKGNPSGSEMALYFKRRGEIPNGPGFPGCRHRMPLCKLQVQRADRSLNALALTLSEAETS
jgi:SAM-dependent methyltransferase